MRWFIKIIARFSIFETTLAWLGCAAALCLLIPAQFWPIKFSHQMLLIPWCALLVVVSYFLGRSFIGIWSVAEQLWNKRMRRRNMESMVQCLDHTERAILREFVIRRSSVLQLPVNEPAVANLLHNGILEMNESQQLLDQEAVVDCVISLAARPLLSYRVLSLPVGNLTGEQLDKLKKLRPAFLKPEKQTARTYSGKVFRIRTVGEKAALEANPPIGNQHPPIAS